MLLIMLLWSGNMDDTILQSNFNIKYTRVLNGLL